MASRPPPPPIDALLVMVGVDDVDEVVLGLTSVVMPAGLVFRRTFFVLGNLLSFLYFIRRFWNQILICLSDRHSACAISILLRRVR